MIPKGAVDKYTAELMIDFCYVPENAAQIEAGVNYICPVKGARSCSWPTDQDVANNPLLFPPAGLSAKLIFNRSSTRPTEKYFNDQFATVIGLG